ncbi:MAG: acetate--CoA ligase family protein [Anaerolineae bacterium]|nr:acetate--CoA ligase family protein [Anaerolineae bacterium]
MGSTVHMVDMDRLLKPRSIVVVGASEKRNSAGRQVVENLRLLKFSGRISPVNPKYDEVLGLECYPSVNVLPEVVDCAAIMVSRKQVLPVLAELVEKGVKAAWVFASGFAEADEEGKRLQREIENLARKSGLLLCGPNCVGVINVAGHVGMCSAPLSESLRPGQVGGVIQSGSVCLALANSARGVGFSYLISTGNEAVLDSTDYMSYLLEDPDTKIVVAFIEGFKSPKKFLRLTERAIDVGKPLIILKVGRSRLAQRAILTHTGALAGSDAVHEALFQQRGVIRVHDLDELLETAELFLKSPLPEGNGVGMITVSGGQIGMMGDLAQGLELNFPELSAKAKERLGEVLPSFVNVTNPLDAWGIGNLEEVYPVCAKILAEEETVDVLVISQDSPPGLAPMQAKQYENVARAAIEVAHDTKKPVVVFSNVSGGFDRRIREILDRGGVPLLQGTRESLKALEKLIWYAKFLRRRAKITRDRLEPPRDLEEVKRHLQRSSGTLPEYETKQILRRYGIPCTVEEMTHSIEEAMRAAQRIGYPIVMKAQSTHIQHKTEAGVIRLNIKSNAELLTAYNEIIANAKRYDPQAAIDGILVQEMLPREEGLEVIVGIWQDKEFGPVIMFGLGGVFVEVLKDISLRVLPITRQDAFEMINEIRGYRLLEEFRGRPRLDQEAIVDVLLRVSCIAMDLKNEVLSIDINPLLVFPEGQGVKGVDALMQLMT